jgi:hypothetical protein
MVEIQIGRAARIRAARDRPASTRRDGSGRWRLRLWTLLNAQALIGGPAGGPADVAVVEDDRQRLAARRGT